MIYKSWQNDLNKRLYIKETFNPEGFEKDLYHAVKETMKFIASYIYLDKTLKDDLKQVRAWYNSFKA